MSIHNERYNLIKNKSIDAPTTISSRSGESKDGIGLLDFIACTQSAEFDLIEAEEAAEERAAKQIYLKLLGLYFKKIYSKKELAFLLECLKGEETPYRIGLNFGVNGYKMTQKILYKFVKYEKIFVKIAKKSGYESRRGLCFAPSLQAYYKKSKAKRALYYADVELSRAKERARCGKRRAQRKIANKAYYKKNKEKILQQVKKYSSVHKSEILAKKREYHEAHREEHNAAAREWYKNNKGYNKQRNKAWREKNEERAKQRDKEYYEKNEEKIKASRKTYYEKNKEKILSKKRACYAANAAEREKINACCRAYYEKNKEKIKAQKRAYNAKRKEHAAVIDI